MTTDEYRSFADPDTHFVFLVYGENEHPTGEVKCEECGRVAGAPEYIPHREGCDQSDVVSKYYAETH